jgi:hypothetical protein
MMRTARGIAREMVNSRPIAISSTQDDQNKGVFTTKVVEDCSQTNHFALLLLVENIMPLQGHRISRSIGSGVSA